MNGLLAAVTELFFRDCYVVDRGVFVECHSFIEIHGQRFFGNKYAQAWWRQNRPPTTCGLVEAFDRSVLELDPDSNRMSLEEIRSKM